MLIGLFGVLCPFIGWMASGISSIVCLIIYLGYIVFRMLKKKKGEDQWRNHIIDVMEKKKIREMKLVEEIKRQQGSDRQV